MRSGILGVLSVLTSKRTARRMRDRARQKRRQMIHEQLEVRDLLAADVFSFDGGDVHPVFAPGTPDEYVSQFDDTPTPGFEEFRLNNRWSTTATNGGGLVNGDATTITWSIVPDGTPISGFNGEPANPSDLVARMRGIYGDAHNPTDTNYVGEDWFAQYVTTFDRWSELSGITYVYESSDDGASISSGASGSLGVRGDVRIGGHLIDGNSGILAYNFYPNTGDMVIDTADGFYNNLNGNSIRLRNVLMHEAGHGIGLRHVDSSNAAFLMEPFINTSFDGPQFDDLLGAHRGYGDFNEKANSENGNNTSANATSVGAIGDGDTLLIGANAVNTRIIPAQSDFVSIDDDSDLDFFKFSVAETAEVDVVLTPKGPTYQEGPQNGAQNPYPTASFSDLTLQVIDSDGSTVLASIDATGLGSAEVVNDLTLGDAGDYFIRVGGKQNQVQMYSLSIGVTFTAVPQEITVLEDGASLTDGASTVDYGATGIGTAISKTYTVRNDGGDPLTLGAIGAMPTGFSLTSGFGDTTLSTGETTTFVVQLDATAAGSFSGPVSFVNNDGNENPFDFTVSGNVLAPNPEIVVLENGISLTDGESLINYGTTPVGDTVTRTFTVRNDGGADLNLGAFNALPTGFTLASGFGDAVLSIGESTTFAVRMDAASSGVYSGPIRFANNDSDEDPFEIHIVGTVAPPPVIIDNNDAGFTRSGASWRYRTTAGYLGDYEYDFAGSGGDTTTWTFTGLTAGEYDVAVSWPVAFTTTSDAPYTVLDGATALGTVDIDQRVAPNDYVDQGVGWEQLGSFSIDGDTLVVRLSDDAGGIVVADAVRIQLADADPAAEIAVAQGGVDLVDGAATVDFGFTPQGASVTRTFTVENKGTDFLNLGSFSAFPSGFSLDSGFGDATLAPAQSTTFVVELDGATLGSYSGSFSFASDDADENPFNIDIEGVVAPADPDITILDGGSNVVDNVTTVDLGTTDLSAPITKIFTVRNDGLSTLNLGAFDPAPSGFSISSGFGDTTLDTGETTTFTVQLDAATEGAFSGAVRFASNDPDESPFDLLVEGDVNPPPVIEIIDNNDSGFTRSGPWRLRTTAGYLGDFEYDFAGSGAHASTWTFSDLAPGEYNVAVSWPAVFVTTTDAPYSVRDGATTLATVDINQKVAPNDFNDNGAAWENLGDFTISGSTLSVVLSDNAEGIVVADAVRIELNAATPVPEIEVKDGATDLTDGASNVDFGLTPSGVPVTKTFTVRNAGDDTLTLGAIAALPSGFTLVSGFGSSTLEAGETTTFAVRLDASSIGSFSGAVSFVNNDGDENPFDFTIEGISASPDADVAVLDGGANVADGVTTIDFGSTTVGTSVSKTFTVRNDGISNLTLGAFAALPSGFTLTADFGASTLATSATTTFTIRMDAATDGDFSGAVSFGNSDPDENPFNFTIEGTVNPEPVVEIVDNNDSGFSRTGTWRYRTTTGHLGDYEYNFAGSGADIATWTFTVDPGDYSVAVSWPDLFSTNDAPYTVLDGATALSTIDVNQDIAPNDFTDAGSSWETLGTFAITGGTLVVQLSDDASGIVIADAVRIERVFGDGFSAAAADEFSSIQVDLPVVSAFHNALDRFDVDNQNGFSLVDVFKMVDHVRREGPAALGELPAERLAGDLLVDVDGDGRFSLVDIFDSIDAARDQIFGNISGATNGLGEGSVFDDLAFQIPNPLDDELLGAIARGR